MMMKSNKLVMTMLILLIAIALVGAVAIVMVLNHTGEAKNSEQPTIDEVIEASVDINEVTTNLASNDFIRISFKIQTDSKEAKEELEKRNFQVNNIIILELSEKTAESIQGREGQLQLEETLRIRINELMQDGKVEKVYITQFLLQ
jgi:flagellar protein FliL